MIKPTYYIFDFDSTFTQVEAMEELAEISLENDPEKEFLIEKIKLFTDLAMDGSMPFNRSLKARIALLSAKKYHINMLVNRLRKRVSSSFIRNKQFFKENKGNVFILSGGFKEFIEPVVKPYFIDADHIFANTFVYDKKNNITGADENNLLAQDKGKVKMLKKLKLQGNIILIGDGYTDYEVYDAGLATKFYAYTENIARQKVLDLSENNAPSLDEILYEQKQSMSLSYPKTRLKALLWGEETFLAEVQLKKEGYRIEKLALNCSKKTLKFHLNESHLLLFSQNAEVSRIGKEAHKLLTAGVWGEIPEGDCSTDLAQKGIALFGSHYAHTRGISELALMMMLQLNRNIGEELHGKKLGIIGYGHSGSMLSVLCTDIGMEVFYYDIDDKLPIGNAQRVKQLKDLLRKCDIVIVTAGKRFGEEAILGQKEINQMQQGAILLNLSYDNSINLDACSEAMKNKKLAGFGMDCLSKELQAEEWNFQNVMLSYQKRLGTKQTQQNISDLLCDKLIAFVNTGNTKGSLNFPELKLPAQQNSHRFIHIHQNKPGVLAQINNLLGRYKINITGQYLKTNADIGFVITDVSKEYADKVLDDLKAIPETIKFRVLY